MNIERVAQSLRLLHQPGSVAELRILNSPKKTISGYFVDMNKMAQAACSWNGRVPAVYTTLNVVLPDLLARSNNRLTEYARATTTDRDIVKRIWLPIDFDVSRPAGISSTDAEHEAALAKARLCRQFLREQGWPDPIYADSGNGAHLDYRVDLPTDSALVQRVLEFLAKKFDDTSVHVDSAMHNPARIWKLYGTKVCKGDSTPDRPHRASAILECPNPIAIVTSAQMETLVGPEQAKTQPRTAQRYEVHSWPPQFDLDAWLDRHQHRLPPLGIKRPFDGSGWKREFEYCPWNADHTNNSAFVGRKPSGVVVAACQHHSCQSKTWHDLKTVVGDTRTGNSVRQSTKVELTDGPDATTEGAITEFLGPEVPGGDEDYVIGISGFGDEGLFPRGDVSLIAAPSGGGKTTWALDMLDAQRKKLRFYGRDTFGLPYFVVMADRGQRSLRRTFKRMGLSGVDVPHAHLKPGAVDIAREIESLVVIQPEIPAVVFIEGIDLTGDSNKGYDVAKLLRNMSAIANHYHLAIICTTGSPKIKGKEGYRGVRELVTGNGNWGRMTETIVVLQKENGSELDDVTVMTVCPRQTKPLQFKLKFENGRLVQVPDKELAQREQSKLDHEITNWVLEQDEFTKPQFRHRFPKLSGQTVVGRLEMLVTSGLVIMQGRPNRGNVKYRVVHSYESGVN